MLKEWKNIVKHKEFINWNPLTKSVSEESLWIKESRTQLSGSCYPQLKVQSNKTLLYCNFSKQEFHTEFLTFFCFYRKWIANDDTCGICRVAFDGCCPDCKIPGDDCPVVWGACTHCFHIHCIMKWINQVRTHVCVAHFISSLYWQNTLKNVN